MIELFSSEFQTPERKSSKGNQLKFTKERIWYKADYLGYEGLAETVVSNLLHFSGLKADEYLDYDPEEILYNSQVFTGCKIDRTVIYPQETRQRVQDIVMEQRRRYAYLFK